MFRPVRDFLLIVKPVLFYHGHDLNLYDIGQLFSRPILNPNRNSGESFYVIDFPIHGKKDVRVRILHHDGCPEALFLMIEFRKRLRARLMITMNSK